MLFPKSRIKWVKSYQGKTDPEGWYVLDIAGLDLDGVRQIHVAAADVEAVRKKGDSSADAAKALFSRLGDGEP